MSEHVSETFKPQTSKSESLRSASSSSGLKVTSEEGDLPESSKRSVASTATGKRWW